ncbi:MAG: alpha-glucan family phosphorylase [Candidatus Heimdallarchaeota archaeon]|nr:MAG: alpha-glucan family phosphorylase [Candidatus Heimdallarchaeota archaeon]
MGEIPKRIERLPELAENLIWAWHPEARELFKELDHPAWVYTNHNPVRMLQIMPYERLQAAAQNPAFLKHYDGVMYDFDRELDSKETWFSENYPNFAGTIAYVSTEYALHQSLPIYSGGLGILSGDHVKESSDLGVPLIGVGFVYPQGYFKQVIPRNGWQKAKYENIKFERTPINPIDNGGEQLIIELEFPNPIYLRVWNLKVGRTQLYLMDTDIEQNQPWDRGLSGRLYGGDQEMRIRQEIVLGFGAVRILSHLGYKPEIYHLNEGHTSFVALELLRREMAENGLTFEEAIQIVKKKIIFTTHTPVPAGHDQFAFDLVSKYFQKYWEGLGINREKFLTLGAFDWGYGQGPRFNMTALGIRLSRYQNAVSKLNREVSREMWTELFSTPEFEDLPLIEYVTNGIHVPTWISPPFQTLYKKYLGKNWLKRQDDPDLWEKIDDIPDEDLWFCREKAKDRMFIFLRERARIKRIEENKDSRQTLAAGALLDPHTLTIGFARRFATYKRAQLIFQDIERLKKNLLDPYTPVQIIFAGKAHPADDPGKSVLQQIYKKAIDPSIGGRVAFIEDYDMQVGRYLVQGCDIWLNTPQKPFEASGTSGMKAAINGGINFSILDGWWPESYDGSNGWFIGGKEPENQQDVFDANSFYDILENEVRPLFYHRYGNGIPTDWIKVVRNSIKSVTPAFSARRMLKEYVKVYFSS